MLEDLWYNDSMPRGVYVRTEAHRKAISLVFTGVLRKQISDADYFVNDVKRDSSGVRRRFARVVPDDKCTSCGLGPEWQGEKLVLQLDHTNGDHTDHRLDNLRWLCPNCHSQTPTYCGRNNKHGSV